jgi:hypothetical protein
MARLVLAIATISLKLNIWGSFPIRRRPPDSEMMVGHEAR